MSWNEDPPRLLDSGRNDSLRALLQAGRDELPSEEQLQQLASRLGPWMGGPGGAGGGGGGAAAGAGGGAAATFPLAKVVVALALGGAAVTAGTLALRSPSSTPVTAQPSSLVAVQAVATESASASASPSAEAPVASASAPQEPKVIPPRASAAASASAGEGPSETALLQQAQGALGSDPGRALALTREHARRFPSGALSQEREAIAIQALVGLGRKAEARARAERFASANPGSAYVRRFEVLIGPLQARD
ncbi:MAG: hypothetical protein HY898_05750 [Deltaproteobacteria bacterium]|nr:hypothetical protein [Deltaproteobacteria bacterium]